jgi:hypothetical protein
VNRTFYANTRRRLKQERCVARYKKLLSVSERLQKYASGRALLVFHQVPTSERTEFFDALRELVSEKRIMVRERRVVSKVRNREFFYRFA